jgi:polysaccharide export outer membrane protein
MAITVFLLSICCSCIPQKRFVYFQQKTDTVASTLFDSSFIARIHPNDILNIFVTSINPEASKYFNFSDRPELLGTTPSSPTANGYLVDGSGNIQLPLIGAVKVDGLTTRMANDTITKKLEKYIESPSVKLNIQNFRVTILGEVARPGMYYISSEKMTITDALAMAGDLTIYGRRENIMIIREENGKKNFVTIDLTSRMLFGSSYYCLHSNDIVYVEPLKTKKVLAENWYRTMPLVLSFISITIVLIRLYQK